MTSQPAVTPADAQNGPQDGPDGPGGSTATRQAPGQAKTGPDGDGDQQTFTADYVKELRDENAKYRTRAKKADHLASLLVTSIAATTGRLADPTDLGFSDDLVDEDGVPDPDKVRAAIDDLLTRKPHLASTRVSGDVGQGVQPAKENVSLAAILRRGAG